MTGKTCEYCERTFAKNQQLIRHRRAHTGEQPFKCLICGKRFSRRDVLVRHKRGHNRGHITDIFMPSLSQQFDPSGRQPSASEDTIFSHPFTSTSENWSVVSAILGINGSSNNNQPSVEDFEALLPDTSSICPNLMPIRTQAIGEALEDVGVGDRASQRTYSIGRQQWPASLPRVPRLTRSLWKDVAFGVDGNLFSRTYISTMPPGTNAIPLSRGELKDESRKEVRTLTERLVPHTCLHESAKNVNPNYSGVTDLSSKCWACQDSSGLLDLGLDLYIRMFQPVMPMLHVPTFKSEEIPALLLFLMCLLGLTFVNTGEATEFIQMAFPAALDAVNSALSADSHRSSNAKIISLLATSIHMMCLIIMTGGTRNEEQCRMLHVQTLTAAQQHGLLTAQCAGALDKSIFEHMADVNTKWKAWSRIESTKRVIVGLILGDAWFSQFLSSGPIIRTEHLNIIVPCDRDLFQAASASDWMQLMKQSGRTKTLDPLVLCPGENRLPVLQSPVDPYAMYGVLFSILLHVSEKLCCLLPSTEPSEVLQHQCIPWKMYAAQSSTGAATSLVARVIEMYGRVLEGMSPHCIVIWHYTVIKLTADNHILECAAGREGATHTHPASQQQALEAIRVWSRTPSARRACLHAAQIFKALSNRRPRDATSFLSIPSLFLAALVLALYLLAAPSPFGSRAVPDVFELLGDVDWAAVGGEGLAEEEEEEEEKERSTGQSSSSSTNNDNSNNTRDATALSDDSNNNSSSAARNFIRLGGLVSINGVIYGGGVQNAQRILLEFACLLDDIPKFKIGEHLRIMYQIVNFLAEGGATGYFGLADGGSHLPVHGLYGILSY